MRYYYDIETEKYISESELRTIFGNLKQENSDIDYSFLHFISNCLTRNNGSLETLQTRKAYLCKELFEYSLSGYETETDFTEEISGIEKEIAYINTLEGGK